MKKVLSLFLLAILLVPVIAKADMGAPETISYNAVVVEEGGIDSYDYNNGEYTKDGHLDKDTILKIHYDSTSKGETYLYGCIDDDYSNCVYVKSTDVLPEGEAVSPDNERVTKLETPASFKVAADEVEVREGPSAAYKSVGKLSKGYIGKYSYIISTHIYVEENGLKGWVEMIGKRVLTKGEGVITVTDVETSCGTIPANTIIADVWTATNYDGVTLINYNGCEDYVKTFHETNIYTIHAPYESTTDSLGKIYNNAKLEQELTTVSPGQTIYVYAAYGGVSEPMPRYVEYNGTKGWYIEDEYAEHFKGQEIEKPVEPEPTEEPTTENKENVETKENKEVTTTGNVEKKTEEKKSSGMDTMTLVLMCVIGALAIALTAVVTILLVNKKKKGTEAPVAPVAAPEPEPTVEANEPTPVVEAETVVEAEPVVEPVAEREASEVVAEEPTPTEEVQEESKEDN